MILGALVIIIVGILVINYFANTNGGEVIPAVNIEDTTKLPTTHVVSEGEDLWTISEKYYGTGYNWTDIASENDIVNPNEIEQGQKLSIPDVESKLAINITETPILTVKEEVEIIPTKEVEETDEPVEYIPGDGNMHVVSEGETLWSISEKYYGTGFNWQEIAKINDLSGSYSIERGQELTIPDLKEEREELAVNKPVNDAVPSENAIASATYTVVKGDDLWNIAVRAYGDGYKWVEIAEENDLDNPDIIHSGNKLRLPR